MSDQQLNSDSEENTLRSRRNQDDVIDMDQELLLNSGRQEDTFSNLKGDKRNIAVLFCLYLLQGIPLGITAAVPILLQNRGISYKQQAEFSFVFWPFSIKLLWAPIVDSVYARQLGRRKTWLIPVQYLLGLSLVYISYHIDSCLMNFAPYIKEIIFAFFLLNVLAATQDIAVDGWALTMLKRENVGHASTCNSVGQSAGYFLGYVIFMALESADFCNTYIRITPQSYGMVSLGSFMYFWGLVFIVVTTFIGIFKKEEDSRRNRGSANVKVNVMDTYKQLLQIVKLPSVQTLAVVLLTCKVAFAACDAVTSLKLMDAGVPKENFAFVAIILTPMQIVLPLILSRYTTGKKPMDVYITAIPYRLGFNIIAALFVAITPHVIVGGNIPLYYYLILTVAFFIHQVALYAMFVSVMGFFARISDPAFGGTYMTLVNTLNNLGGNWPSTLALYCVESLTWKGCSNSSDNTCASPDAIKACEAGGGHCVTRLDGYYIETAVCTVFGYFWLYSWGRRTIQSLQNRSENEWKVGRLKR